MGMTKKDVVMMRLVNQATAQGLIVAQHYQTREILLFAPTGEVHRHPNVSLVRGCVTMPTVGAMGVDALLKPGFSVRVCRC